MPSATLKPVTRYLQPLTPPILLSAAGSRLSTGISLVLSPKKTVNNGPSPAPYHLRLHHNLHRHNRRPLSMAPSHSSSSITLIFPAAHSRPKSSKIKFLQPLCLIWPHRSSFPSQWPHRSTVVPTACTGTAKSINRPIIAVIDDKTFRPPPCPYHLTKH